MAQEIGFHHEFPRLPLWKLVVEILQWKRIIADKAAGSIAGGLKVYFQLGKRSTGSKIDGTVGIICQSVSRPRRDLQICGRRCRAPLRSPFDCGRRYRSYLRSGSYALCCFPYALEERFFIASGQLIEEAQDALHNPRMGGDLARGAEGLDGFLRTGDPL